MSQIAPPLLPVSRQPTVILILARIANALLGAALIFISLGVAYAVIANYVESSSLVFGVNIASAVGILAAGLILVLCALGIGWNHSGRALLSLIVAILASAVTMHLAADQLAGIRTGGTVADQNKLMTATLIGTLIPIGFSLLGIVDLQFLLQDFAHRFGPPQTPPSLARRIVRIGAPIVGLLGVAVTFWASSRFGRNFAGPDFSRGESNVPVLLMAQYLFSGVLFVCLALMGIWRKSKAAAAVAFALALILFADFAGAFLGVLSSVYARVPIVGRVNQSADPSLAHELLTAYLSQGPIQARLAVQALLLAFIVVAMAALLRGAGQPPQRHQAGLRLGAQMLFYWHGLTSLLLGAILVATALVAHSATHYYMTAIVPDDKLTALNIAGGTLALVGCAALIAGRISQRPTGIAQAISLVLASMQGLAFLALGAALTLGYIIPTNRAGVRVPSDRALFWCILLILTSITLVILLVALRPTQKAPGTPAPQFDKT